MKRRVARHPKLTEEGMALMLAQVDLRLALLSYAEIASRTGLTPNSVRVTMWNLMHERREGKVRVHHGTAENQSRVAAVLAELRIE